MAPDRLPDLTTFVGTRSKRVDRVAIVVGASMLLLHLRRFAAQVDPTGARFRVFDARILGWPLASVRIANVFVLTTAEPTPASLSGRVVREIRRIGKRIAIGLDGDVWLVIHLMIAGRLHWRKPQARLAGRNDLVAFDFAVGTLVLTEAGTKRRASLHVVAGENALLAIDPGAINVLASDLSTFRRARSIENHTLKRALTDPQAQWIGKVYSDEILAAACLSPIALTQKLSDAQWERLFVATCATLQHWI